MNINTIKNNNSFKIVGYDSICTFCNGIQGSEISYNSLGLIDTVKDFKDNITKYIWNNDKKLTQVIEAFGTSLERTSNFSYNSSGFLSTKSEPVSGGYKTTTYTYNSNNLITHVNETAPSNNPTSQSILKTFSFIYEQDKIVKARGPLYNAQNQNKVSFTYNTKGQISSVSNGLNQTTHFNNYDDYGNVTQITLPNSNVILMDYDLRGRLTSSTLKSSLLSTDGETTSYTYSVNGLVSKVTKPSGSSYVLGYDNASRLIIIEEWSEPTTTSSNGVYMGKLSYSLDNMRFVRQLLDIGSVNNCSGFYLAGELTDTGMNIASLGCSIYLKSLVKGWTKNSGKPAYNYIEYKKLQEPGYAVHHIQPLKGHYGIQGVKAGYPTLFPTGGLRASIASHPLNLKKIPTSEHKILHRRLYNQEKFWEINHSVITSSLKTEIILLEQCGCK